MRTSLSRRDFCELLSAGVPASLLRPTEPSRRLSDAAPTPIRLDSNENPYGPSQAARAAIEKVIGGGGRYPSTGELITVIAAANRVAESNVLLTVGATEALVICAKAFTGPDAPLVTAAPTYAAIATATEQLGHPVIRVPIRPDGHLDLEAMGGRARRAGIIYVCNPNNPTGTLIGAGSLRDFITRVAELSPETTIVVGEAYHEYIEAADYASAVAEAVQSPRVLVTRTFSKLYGLAGLRIGYLVGREESLRRVSAHRVPLGANAAALAAAAACLGDDAERARQRQLNREGRAAAERFFADRGWRFYPAVASYLFVDVRREIAAFRTACQTKGLLIGRPYPPASARCRKARRPDGTCSTSEVDWPCRSSSRRGGG